MHLLPCIHAFFCAKFINFISNISPVFSRIFFDSKYNWWKYNCTKCNITQNVQPVKLSCFVSIFLQVIIPWSYLKIIVFQRENSVELNKSYTFGQDIMDRIILVIFALKPNDLRKLFQIPSSFLFYTYCSLDLSLLYYFQIILMNDFL
jgi:hypothetical protein